MPIYDPTASVFDKLGNQSFKMTILPTEDLKSMYIQQEANLKLSRVIHQYSSYSSTGYEKSTKNTII